MWRPSVGGVRDYTQIEVAVISHDCEWTKAQAASDAHPFLVAPLSPLTDFDGSDGRWGHIRGGEYVIDFREIQPIAVDDLKVTYYMTSMSPVLKQALQAALVVFFTDRRPKP